MRWVLLASLALCAWVLVAGSPVARDLPHIDYHYGSPDPILPMTFAHVDHPSVGCVECHHNYVDDTGNGLCMNCHVTDPELLPVLAEQFHDLCQGCHSELAAKQEASGPPRRCIECHLTDTLP